MRRLPDNCTPCQRHRATLRALAVGVLLALAWLPARAQAPWAGDARVLQRVSVDAGGLALPVLLSEVSRRTGVALSAPGEIGSEKVIVHARERALSELLADLAELLGGEWSRSQAGGYRLRRSAAASAREAAILRETADRLAAQVDRYIRALALTPAQLAALPEGDPVREYVSQPRNRTGLTFYALLSRQQRNALWTRRRLSIPFAALSPGQRQAAATIFGDTIQQLQAAAALRSSPSASALPIPSMEDLDDGALTFRLRRMGGQVLLILQIAGVGIPLATMPAQAGWVVAPRGDPYEARPEEPRPPLPAARLVERAAAGAGSWAARLERLARETGLPVLSDAYRAPPVTDALGAGDRQAANRDAAALDALCRAPGVAWWKRGDALLFRRRDWPIQRAHEPPDDFLDRMAARLRPRNGMPSIDCILLLRELTQAQIAGMNGLISPLADEGLLDGLGDLLDLLSAVPRRALALEPRGVVVSPSALPPTAQRALAALLAAADAPAAAPGSTLIIQATRSTRSGARPGAPSCAQVGLRWTFGRARGSYVVFLPESVPDDRRGNTRVVVVPP
ncbi:MAG TPA: hypothetical protein VLH79_01605 [Chthonomonadales bacterium]|nr:hypothetical protein [Chthonomonadales bacterium]